MPIPNNPITRKEAYLAAIAGQEVAVPAYPITREESYLDAIAKNGSGGASYEIKGAYDTEEELKTAHPTGEAGDAYLVGDPSHVYVWLTEESEWSDAGEFTAIEGPQGPAGADGAPGQDGEDGLGIKSVDINTSNHLIVTYDDDTTHDAGEIEGSVAPEYPDYAATERDAVAAKINNYITTLNNPIIIGFNTDQHIIAKPSSESAISTRDQIAYGLRTLRDLTKQFPFNLTVLGGDTNGGGSSSTVLAMQESSLYVTNQMDGVDCPLATLVGNHEGGQDNENITRAQVYKSHMTPSMQNKVIVSAETVSGYFDDPTCKVRFVFIDNLGRSDVGYTSTDYNTILSSMLSGIPEGYKAIIFSHKPLDENLPEGWNNPTPCHDTIQLYKDKIIACICGHIHNNLYLEDFYGITFVATTCAGVYELNDGSTRTSGTADYTAYDVFVIDQDNKTIHAVRYGNGEDRTISYVHSQARGNILNDITWQDGKRINSSGQIVDASGYSVTEIIDDVNAGDTLYFADGTLPMTASTWTKYNDDGTSGGSYPGIDATTYGATYEGNKMYLQLLNSSSSNLISYYWKGINDSKNPQGTSYDQKRFIYGELELWNSGFVKSVKIAYDSGNFSTTKKIRFTFPTAKKGSLDIRVNEPIS